MKLKTLLLIICISSMNRFSYSQTFDCYVSNDTLISKTHYEFDIYILSTSEDFLFRSIQLSFKINPEFTPKGTPPVISYVEGSSKLKIFNPGLFKQNSSPSLSAFQMSTCTPYTCDKGTLISKKPVLIGRFRIESKSGDFSKAEPELKMIGPKEIPPKGEVNLKMSVTKWNSLDCSLPTSKLISMSGNFYSK